MFNKKDHQKIVMNPEQRALERLHNGDIDALGFLYDSYVDDLFELGIRYVNDESWIEDQIHDLFLDLYKSRHNVLNIYNIKAYLSTSLKRRLYKKSKTRELLIEEGSFHHLLRTSPDHIEESAESQWIDMEKVAALKSGLKSAMDSLTKHQQSALHLRFMENKSYFEIAKHMDVSTASARTLLYRSLKALREKIQILLF